MLKLNPIVLLFILEIGLIFAQPTFKPSKETEFCYEYLGCFNQERPFDEFHLYKESDPEIIKQEYSLYTYDAPESEEILSYKEPESIRTSSFKKELPLKIIVHGYANDKKTPWMVEMKDKLFASENLNIIIVSWGNGAKYPDYDYAASNTRVVGRGLGLILNQITNSFYPEDAENFSIHCIGHSLGAHLCGYASELSTVFFDRITGLDPANKFFEMTYHTVRVDPRDAKFVDIIHTDIGAMTGRQQGNFGIMMETGTVDFYVNGGLFQPGCPTTSIYAMLDPNNDKGCSHNRAIKYFIESIDTTCPFTSFKCDSWDNYQKGLCRTCKNDSCSILGYLSDNFRSLGSFYVATMNSAKGPFCGLQYLFEMKINSRSPKTAGKIYLKFDKGKSSEETIQITDLNFDIMARDKVQRVIVSKNDISRTERNSIKFEKKTGGLFGIGDPYNKNFYYDKIKLEFFDIKETYAICLSNRPVTSGKESTIRLQKGDCH